ncbi:MAG: hypothetical protein JWO56_2281, partial [Acidobacteria bacterium]|nr:hypothetical protein [Acidobacteriota bacterium]
QISTDDQIQFAANPPTASPDATPQASQPQ